MSTGLSSICVSQQIQHFNQILISKTTRLATGREIAHSFPAYFWRTWSICCGWACWLGYQPLAAILW